MLFCFRLYQSKSPADKSRFSVAVVVCLVHNTQNIKRKHERK